MTNIEKLLAILMRPIQRVENVLIDMKLKRDINTAVGAQLDIIGRIVGQPRNGESDDEVYRRFCRARVLVNKSSGVPEELIKIAIVAVDDDSLVVIVRPSVNASIEIDVTSIPISESTARILAILLVAAVSAGVRLMLAYAVSPSAGLFRFDSGPGWDVGHLAGAKDYLLL